MKSRASLSSFSLFFSESLSRSVFCRMFVRRGDRTTEYTTFKFFFSLPSSSDRISILLFYFIASPISGITTSFYYWFNLSSAFFKFSFVLVSCLVSFLIVFYDEFCNYLYSSFNLRCSCIMCLESTPYSMTLRYQLVMFNSSSIYSFFYLSLLTSRFSWGAWWFRMAISSSLASNFAS